MDSGASCTNPGGFLAETGVKARGADHKISMDAGSGHQFWLQVFVADAPTMAPVEAGAAASPETVEWAKAAIKPEGVEVARFVDTESGKIAKTVELQPGNLQMGGCMPRRRAFGADIPGDDDQPAQGMACADGGTASKVVEVSPVLARRCHRPAGTAMTAARYGAVTLPLMASSSGGLAAAMT